MGFTPKSVVLERQLVVTTNKLFYNKDNRYIIGFNNQSKKDHLMLPTLGGL